MKAPKYQRMDALEAAVLTAGYELDDPIEGLEVTDDGVVAWAQGRFILMNSRWNQDYGPDGSPALGGGRWSADYVRDCDASSLTFGGRAAPRPWWRVW